MKERGAVVVVLVLLGAAVAAVLRLTPVSVPLLGPLHCLLAPVGLDEHVEGEGVLGELKLCSQLLLLGLQLLQDQRGLDPLPRLHEVSLLQDVQLQLLQGIKINTDAVRYDVTQRQEQKKILGTRDFLE